MATTENKIGQQKVDGLFDDSYSKTIDEIIDEISVPNSTDDEDEQQVEITGLAHFVRHSFCKSENARQLIEDRWLNDLRQYKGIHPSDVLANISANRSRAFRRITRNKVKTLDSRLGELLFPANGEKNWGIEPTPIPDIDKEQLRAVQEIIYEQTGEVLSETDMFVIMEDIAREKADNMTKTIEDQLAELQYRQIMRDVIHSGHVYGTGILKGPLVTINENKQYYRKQKQNNGKYKWILQEYDAITPFVEQVSVWDMYPDMDSISLSDARYVIQRRKMDKHQVLGLAKRSDFDADVINGYLMKHSSGDYVKKDFESTLASLGDVTFNGKEWQSYSESVSEGGVNRIGSEKKYEVLEYWGYVDAEDLEHMGVEIPEDKKGVTELVANIWVIGDLVIKASLSPVEGVKFPYFFYYYDKDETSIFGEGVPAVIRDDQAIMNTALRMMLDNAAISMGPQVEINSLYMDVAEEHENMYPFKIWYRTGDGPDATNPAIKFHEIPSYTPQLAQIIEMARESADEDSAIPRYLWGEASGGVARTASGLSMLMGSANIAIKDLVRNFDEGITKPFITAMYFWNMEFSEDESIKGDYGIVAQGSTSLIQKEADAERYNQFSQIVSNPMYSNIVHHDKVLRAIARAYDVQDNGFIMTEDEIAQREQQAQAEAQSQREYDTLIIEAAREQGISPQALLDTLGRLRQEMEEPLPDVDTSVLNQVDPLVSQTGM